MPINMAQLALDTATTTVEFQGHLADIVYRPNVLTTGMLQKVALRYEQNDIAGIIDFLVEVISDWELYRGDVKLPVNTDSIMGLPVVFLKAILVAVMEDSSAGEVMGA